MHFRSEPTCSNERRKGGKVESYFSKHLEKPGGWFRRGEGRGGRVVARVPKPQEGWGKKSRGTWRQSRERGRGDGEGAMKKKRRTGKGGKSRLQTR